MTLPDAFAAFLAEAQAALGTADSQTRVAAALARLVARDDWLPAACAQPHPAHYQQYALWVQPGLSVVSFVWGPGQSTPVHDHGVWGAVGVLRGAELSQAFAADGSAPPRALGPPHRLAAGELELVGPDMGPGIYDVHQVRNALTNAVSVSIHAYGTDIGRHPRHVFPPSGGVKPFISGYANDGPAFAVDMT